MHRSRIGVVLIDQPAATYGAAASFWAGASGVGRDRDTAPPPEDPYEPLSTLSGVIPVHLQRLADDTPARLHVDFETDDVDAEVARLTALGATLVERRDGYCIMNDPGGVPFCVVPVQTPESFESHAITWDA